MRNSWEQAGENALGKGSQSSYNPYLGAAGGLLGGFLGNMFGGQDPNSYMSGIPDTLSKYLGPYAQMGQQLMPGVEQGYKSMMNPSQFLSKVGQGFQEDPGYQFQKSEAQNAAQAQSAAGGMAGSPQAQQYAATLGNQMANQDYNQYMNRAMGAYQTGLGGLSGLENQGFQGAGDLASGLDQYSMTQAQIAAAQNASQQNELGAALGAAGSLAAFL